jgi:hypothetical protein
MMLTGGIDADDGKSNLPGGPPVVAGAGIIGEIPVSAVDSAGVAGKEAGAPGATDAKAGPPPGCQASARIPTWLSKVCAFMLATTRSVS